MHIDGSKERKGSAGRIPDAIASQHVSFKKINISLPKELNDRLVRYCEEDERAKSWAIQKALDKWLQEKGY